MLFQNNSSSDLTVGLSGKVANGPTGDRLAARPLAFQFSKNMKRGSSVSIGTTPRAGLPRNRGSIGGICSPECAGRLPGVRNLLANECPEGKLAGV